VQEVSKLARASAIAASVVLTALAAQPGTALAGSDPTLKAASSHRTGVPGGVTQTDRQTGIGWGHEGRHGGGTNCPSEKHERGEHHGHHQRHHHHQHQTHHAHGGTTCRCAAPVPVPTGSPVTPPAPPRSVAPVRSTKLASAPVRARAVAVPATGAEIPVGQGLALAGLGSALLAASRRLRRQRRAQ
jgi:hypothetical protein